MTERNVSAPNIRSRWMYPSVCCHLLAAGKYVLSALPETVGLSLAHTHTQNILYQTFCIVKIYNHTEMQVYINL